MPLQGASDRSYMRSPRVKTVIAFSALIILLVCIFIAFQASKSYKTVILEGQKNAERLNNIMADQVQLTFLAVDLTLKRVVERHYFNQMFGNNLTKDIEHNLRLWVDGTPQIAAILVIDETGVTRVAAFERGYQSHIAYRESFKEHPLFKRLEQEEFDGFSIANQADFDDKQANLLLAAHQINKVDGSFGGIVLAVIDPEFFTDFFTSVDIGSNRFMALIEDDGSTLYSGPRSSKWATERTLNHIRSDVVEKREERLITLAKTVDEEIQLFSFQRLKKLPISVVVVIHENDFLMEWRDSRIKDVSFLAIFTIFGSVLSYFALTMAKQIVRVEESEAAAILASQAKSEFLANMSHELRTPLNAIIGFSEMINAGYFGELNDKQSERIHDINLCGSHLLQLISDILEFSKGEAGKLELHEETVDLKESMEECTRIINEKARSKQIELSVEASDNLPKLLADKRKVRQVLLNLMSNAIKFTPENGKVTLSARKDRHGNVHMSVTDNGIGIPESEIQKAMSVFGQVHRSQSHEGTGLGLPLCKMFMELHGGRMVLTSKVGEGTKVTGIFPPERVIEG